MNSCREFRERVKIKREGSAQRFLLPKFFGALRLFILFLFLSNNAISQNDIGNQQSNPGNQQYDLNDPRNPDCPCHKYQKLADDEYNKKKNNDLQQQFALNVNISNLPNINISNLPNININNLDNINVKDNNVGTDNSSYQAKRDFSLNKREVSSGSGSTGSKAKKKKHGLWLRKKINRSKLKNSRIKKVRPDYTVCYKW